MSELNKLLVSTMRNMPIESEWQRWPYWTNSGLPDTTLNLVKVRQLCRVYCALSVCSVFFFSPFLIAENANRLNCWSVKQLHCDAVLKLPMRTLSGHWFGNILSCDCQVIIPYICVLHCFTFLYYPMQAALEHLAIGLLIRSPNISLVQCDRALFLQVGRGCWTM